MLIDTAKHQIKKNEIINATFKSVYEHGIDGISMRIIAREAHVNQATLHYYFINKENLLVELLEVPPRKKLREIIYSGRDSIENNKEMFIVFMDFWAMSIRIPAMRQSFANLYMKISDIIENVYEDGVKEGIFPPLPRGMMSVLIYGFVEGIGMQWHMRENDFNLGTFFDFLLKDMLAKLNLEESGVKIS
jgi:AcrR family transcriptional regulator